MKQYIMGMSYLQFTLNIRKLPAKKDQMKPHMKHFNLNSANWNLLAFHQEENNFYFHPVKVKILIQIWE